jgi:hypothetical protein
VSLMGRADVPRIRLAAPSPRGPGTASTTWSDGCTGHSLALLIFSERGLPRVLTCDSRSAGASASLVPVGPLGRSQDLATVQASPT